MDTRDDLTALPGETADYIIVGGGSAGCVLANRLSADPSVRVILMEAGTDFIPGGEPPHIRNIGMRAHFNPGLFWPGLFAENTRPPKDVQSGPMAPFMQARVIGGGSAINGMHAQRGAPEDYDEWRQLGVEGWGWTDILPYFKRLEHDVDFEGPLHGKAGPIEIRRVKDSEWGPLALAFRTVLEKRGVPRLADINGELGDGVGPVPLNISRDARISSAAAYLTGDVRRRPNLKILPNSTVKKLITDGKRVTGVEFERDGRHQWASAPETILSCGALHTPALLLRSGIGPAQALQELGIKVVADRAGVGKNLLNHPMLIVSAHLRSAGRRSPRLLPPCTVVARYSSKAPGCPPADMLINLWDRSFALGWDPLGRQLANAMIIVNKSYSQGEVDLDPSNPAGSPRVRFNLLHDQLDRDRMIAGFRFVCALLAERPASDLVDEIFLAQPTAANAILFQDSPKAKLYGAAAAFALGSLSSVRRRVLKGAVLPVAEALADEAAIDRAVMSQVMPGGHVAGTCRLGSPFQKEAVADSRCCVIDVEGLRVVDASIFPTLMTAGTNLPVMMAAEKAADMAKEDRRNRSAPRIVAMAQSA